MAIELNEEAANAVTIATLAEAVRTLDDLKAKGMDDASHDEDRASLMYVLAYFCTPDELEALDLKEVCKTCGK
jgi:hypothetical protein